MRELKQATEFLIENKIADPSVGLVPGTGLHKLLEFINIKRIIPYSQIPGFPASTVDFHKGNIFFGTIVNKTALIMQGRFHFYEGYSMQQIVFPLRVMKLLGVKTLFLSNAAGGINLNFKKGDLVLISDHINLQSGNPLIGKNNAESGSPFTAMREPYNVYLSYQLLDHANQLKIDLKKGVYAAVNGPNLETRAEYRFLKIIGADMVGMSTVPEVIAANHINLPCAAISVITDECDPDNLKPVNIEEIIEIAGKADEKLSSLLSETIKAI
jgi:purine-nucleoside phosphorylase